MKSNLGNLERTHAMVTSSMSRQNEPLLSNHVRIDYMISLVFICIDEYIRYV